MSATSTRTLSEPERTTAAAAPLRSTACSAHRPGTTWPSTTRQPRIRAATGWLAVSAPTASVNSPCRLLFAGDALPKVALVPLKLTCTGTAWPSNSSSKVASRSLSTVLCNGSASVSEAMTSRAHNSRSTVARSRRLGTESSPKRAARDCQNSTLTSAAMLWSALHCDCCGRSRLAACPPGCRGTASFPRCRQRSRRVPGRALVARIPSTLRTCRSPWRASGRRWRPREPVARRAQSTSDRLRTVLPSRCPPGPPWRSR